LSLISLSSPSWCSKRPFTGLHWVRTHRSGLEVPPPTPNNPDRGSPEIASPVLASSGTIAELFFAAGSLEVRLWPPLQFPG
jgi:hypothetical protein